MTQDDPLVRIHARFSVRLSAVIATKILGGDAHPLRLRIEYRGGDAGGVSYEVVPIEDLASGILSLFHLADPLSASSGR